MTIRRPVQDIFDVLAAVEALAKHFNVAKPDIHWSRSRRGFYRPRPVARISLGPSAWTGMEQCLLHEFAHHLDWNRTQTCSHGPTFHRALTDVAATWFGNPALYDWTKEYERLKAAGPMEHPLLKIDTEKLLADL